MFPTAGIRWRLGTLASAPFLSWSLSAPLITDKVQTIIPLQVYLQTVITVCIQDKRRNATWLKSSLVSQIWTSTTRANSSWKSRRKRSSNSFENYGDYMLNKVQSSSKFLLDWQWIQNKHWLGVFYWSFLIGKSTFIRSFCSLAPLYLLVCGLLAWAACCTCCWCCCTSQSRRRRLCRRVDRALPLSGRGTLLGKIRAHWDTTWAPRRSLALWY